MRRLPLEIPVVWLLFAVVALELVVTYARFDAGELYNVSGSGVEGGASRLLVFLNFPVALAAIAVLLLLAESLAPAAVGGVRSGSCSRQRCSGRASSTRTTWTRGG